ncbi:MAG: hypothetical protein V3V95_04835 [Thermodesulfobacteriota bacterium]
MNKHYENFLFILLLSLVFSQAFINIYDYDVWFHIKAGEYMLAHREILKVDVFSYTALGEPWLTHEWLFEILIYLVYALGSLSGVTLFKALIITAVFAVYLVYFRRISASGPVYIVVLAIASILARERFIERPEIITYLFSALFITMLEILRRKSAGFFRFKEERLWVLPVLMILWANFHSGAIFAIAITGAYALGELAGAFSGALKVKSKGSLLEQVSGSKRLRAFILILFLTFIAGFFNPNTYHVYTYPFQALDISSTTGLNLAEYARPLWATDSFFFVAFFLSLVIFIVNIVINFRRTVIAHLTLFVFFSLLALKYNRNIAIWAIISAPFVVYYIDELLSYWPSIMPATGKPGNSPATLAVRIIAVALAILIVLPFPVRAARAGWWGPGIMEGVFPERAINFLDKNSINGNMFNSYEFGGYLIWRSFPERKVYIDGRSDIYIDLLMEQRKLSILGFEKLVETYDIDYLILSYSPSTVKYVNPNPVFGKMLALVFFDDVSMVYLRRTPENSAIIARLEYKYVRPTDTELRFTDLSDPESLAGELKRNLKINPGAWRSRQLLKRLSARLER